jgi:hypothetical protein
MPTDITSFIAELDQINTVQYNTETIANDKARGDKQVELLRRIDPIVLHDFFRFTIVPGAGHAWSQPLLDVLVRLTPSAIFLLRQKIFFKEILPGPTEFANNILRYPAGAQAHFLLFAGECVPLLAEHMPGRLLAGIIKQVLPYVKNSSLFESQGVSADIFMLHLGGIQLMLNRTKDLKDHSTLRPLFIHLIETQCLQPNKALNIEMLYVLHKNYDATGRNNHAWTELKNVWLDCYAPEARLPLDKALMDRLNATPYHRVNTSSLVSNSSSVFGAALASTDSSVVEALDAATLT